MKIMVAIEQAEAAANEIMRLIEEHGGEWMVNAVGGEGFIMARVGSLHCAQLERSGSPCLCGPFSAGWNIAYVSDDLEHAKGGDYREARTEAQRRYSRESQQRRRGRPKIERYTPEGEEAKIAEALTAGPMTLADVSERVNLPSKRVGNVIRKLRNLGCVKLAGTKAPASGGTQFVYGLAA